MPLRSCRYCGREIRGRRTGKAGRAGFCSKSCHRAFEARGVLGAKRLCLRPLTRQETKIMRSVAKYIDPGDRTYQAFLNYVVS